MCKLLWYPGSQEEHEISSEHHGVAFIVALCFSITFSGWCMTAFFEVKREPGWANLPRVTLTDKARKLMNSVDKESKV